MKAAIVVASLLRRLVFKYPYRVRLKPRSKNVDIYLKRNFTLWIKRVLLSDNKEEDVLYEQANNLVELKTMLADRFSQWKENYKQEYLEKGIEKGEINKERSLLLRLIKLRFGGSFCHTIEPVILSIDSTKRLDQIADWIISCDDKNNFQTRVEQLTQI